MFGIFFAKVAFPEFPEQKWRVQSQNGLNYEKKYQNFPFLTVFVSSVTFSRYKQKIAVRVYLKLFALLSCMSVSCVQLNMSSETWSRDSNTENPQKAKYGWWFVFVLFSSFPLPPPVYVLVKVWVLWFPCNLKRQWRGRVHTSCVRLTPERLRRSVHVVCFWVFLKKFKKKKEIKKVVKCHQPCVQWNAFQKTTTTETIR